MRLKPRRAMGCRNVLLIIVALLGAELHSTSVALRLELLDPDDVIQKELGYTNNLMMYTEEKERTATHQNLAEKELPHVKLPFSYKSLRFRWRTTVPEERGMRYIISHGEQPGSRPISPAVKVSFGIPQEGSVPVHNTEFTVSILCTARSPVPERFVFNILATVPGRNKKFYVVINLQKKCLAAETRDNLQQLQQRRSRKAPCKILCKKPNPKKLKRRICKLIWVLFAVFARKYPEEIGQEQVLHFTDAQAYFKTAHGDFLKSERSYGNATVIVPAQLTMCHCVKKLKRKKKYALFAVGEWGDGNLSDLSILPEQSLLLRKFKVRQHVKNVQCLPW